MTVFRTTFFLIYIAGKTQKYWSERSLRISQNTFLRNDKQRCVLQQQVLKHQHNLLAARAKEINDKDNEEMKKKKLKLEVEKLQLEVDVQKLERLKRQRELQLPESTFQAR